MDSKTYWNIDSGDGNSLSAGIQLEVEARKIAQRRANERGESVYLYEVGNGDGESEVESEEIRPEEIRPLKDPVTLEYMPMQHRGSHRAAGNWGVYPHNGAVREEMSRENAELMAATDGDGYDHIVEEP
jgi:hypothetical protein